MTRRRPVSLELVRALALVADMRPRRRPGRPWTFDPAEAERRWRSGRYRTIRALAAELEACPWGVARELRRRGARTATEGCQK